MRYPIMLAIGCLLLGAVALAQPDPDQPPPTPRWLQNLRAGPGGQQLRELIANQRPQMLVTPQGLLVLKGGVLLRLDPATLEQRQLLELFGPLPIIPLGAVTPEQRQQAALGLLPRYYPAVMVPVQDDVLIVIGDAYFRVHATDLTIAAQSRFDQPFAQNADNLRNLLDTPTALVHEQSLYLTRGNQVLAINIADGKAQAVGNLPWQMQPLTGQVERLAGQGQQAKNARFPDAPRAVTVIGIVIKQQDEAGEHWLLRGEDGIEYTLDGNGMRKLATAPNIVGKRVRVTGTQAANDDAAAAPKTLTVVNYQLLPK